MKRNHNLLYQTFYGKEISGHAHQVAVFRIRYFKEFPYLYEGNLEYEKKYLDAYSADEKSMLIKVTDDEGSLLAVSTALPLITPSDILDGAPAMFSQIGHHPGEIFYYGEIILDHSLRGKGIVRKIYEMQDDFAKENGYSKIAIATVVREDEDSRKPPGYISSDLIWKNLGFEKTSLSFDYHWPTIQADGKVIDAMNPMIYWIKPLK